MSEKSPKKANPRPVSKAIPVRFPDHMITAIEEAVRITGMPQQEIIRLAVGAGLKDLTKIKYNIAEAIHAAAKRKKSK